MFGPLGPLGFEYSQHRQTLRPSLQPFLREGRVVGPCWAKLTPKEPKGSVDGIRSKALRPFGVQ
jgi:hypothetical protein